MFSASEVEALTSSTPVRLFNCREVDLAAKDLNGRETKGLTMDVDEINLEYSERGKPFVFVRGSRPNILGDHFQASIFFNDSGLAVVSFTLKGFHPVTYSGLTTKAYVTEEKYVVKGDVWMDEDEAEDPPIEPYSRSLREVTFLRPQEHPFIHTTWLQPDEYAKIIANGRSDQTNSRRIFSPN